MGEPAARDPRAVDLRDYVAFRDDGPASHRVLATDVLAVDVVSLAPGQFIGARELGDSDVVYTVLGGRAWIVTPGAEVDLGPLQAVLIPAGVTHGVRNDGADPLILQAAASPADGLPALAEGPARRPVQRGGPAPQRLSRLQRFFGGAS